MAKAADKRRQKRVQSEADSAVVPVRGRPKDPDKRLAILSAAKDLFTGHGLQRTSMENIASVAGVSKLTLYSHFKNKELLFRETVQAKCNEHWPEDTFNAEAAVPIRARMLEIATGFLDLIFTDSVLNMYRLMTAEHDSDSRFGKLFWEFGPERTITRFAEFLEAAHVEGELNVPDARVAAGQFFVLLKGEHHSKCLVGAAPPLARSRRLAHAESVVNLFLAAYAA